MKSEDAQAIGHGIDAICEKLPDGWSVEIELERHGGCVRLFDEDFEHVDFPCNCEGLQDELVSALEFAILEDARRRRSPVPNP